ncbi:hypothetical protein E2C01_011875 [Portunus trituberculatus]|uniref:Uncharacterized protein n=1 Tax=Portunus trituberculatus TaxID=210409 RepID=A0A5B7DD56_PORTR|nr:hypothetical protein [Portunus trituberculatus]
MVEDEMGWVRPCAKRERENYDAERSKSIEPATTDASVTDEPTSLTLLKVTGGRGATPAKLSQPFLLTDTDTGRSSGVGRGVTRSSVNPGSKLLSLKLVGVLPHVMALLEEKSKNLKRLSNVPDSLCLTFKCLNSCCHTDKSRTQPLYVMDPHRLSSQGRSSNEHNIWSKLSGAQDLERLWLNIKYCHATLISLVQTCKMSPILKEIPACAHGMRSSSRGS